MAWRVPFSSSAGESNKAIYCNDLLSDIFHISPICPVPTSRDRDASPHRFTTIAA